MARHVVVDGSNIATEGRSMPSLKQLNEAVLAFIEENPDAKITVVVDATFGHRIDESERAEFEEAEAHGELTSPPAGAIGRGDAFVLRIAEKVGAVVLSNDSFQEFHGEHEWLFEKGRLIGGKPVPGVGWIFTPRTPVRGPKSREAVKEAKRTRVRLGSKDASAPMPVPKAPPPSRAAAAKAAETVEAAKPRGRRGKAVERAIAEAVEEAVEPEEAAGGGRRGRRRKRKAAPPAQPLNDPATFLSFVTAYQPGSDVEGAVESFSSHGAFVLVDGARCYVPLSAMGDPPPRAAREVLTRGETRAFVVQAFDAPRRGIELALPGFAQPAGAPTEETVEAEITEAAPRSTRRTRTKAAAEPVAEPAPAKRTRKKQAAAAEAAPAVEPAAPVEDPAPAKRTRKKAAATSVAAEAAPVAAGRGRKKAATAEAAAAPAKRTRKKAAEPAVEIGVVEAPAPAKRARKKAVAEPAEAPTKAAARTRKKAAATVEEAPPAPAARTRKKAAAPVVDDAPAPAKRTRKKAAAGPAVEVEVVETPARTTRTRKKAATSDEAPAAPAPAKRTRKKAAAPEA